MEVWVIVIIRLLLYPIFFQVVLGIFKSLIGMINSIKHHNMIEDGKPVHEIRLNIHKWEQNSKLPKDDIKRLLLFALAYFALKSLIFQLISVSGGGMSLGPMWNIIIMMLSLIIYAKIINPIFVVVFSKYIPGFKERWERR